MIVCGTGGNYLRKRHLRQSELPLPKALYAGYAVEETHKYARETLKSNEISKHSKSWSYTSAQAKGLIKKHKFCK